MISRANALSLGITQCRKNSCTGCDPLTYASLGLKPRSLPEEYYLVDESQVKGTALQIADVPNDILPDRLMLVNESENGYIGNKNSHVFHFTSCSSVKDMKKKT